MGALAGVLANVGSGIASAASSVSMGGAIGSVAQGAADAGGALAQGVYNAGKERLSTAWKEATGGITVNDNLGDAAYKAGKALMSSEYGKSQAPSAPTNDQPQVVPAQAQAPDAKNELDKLMSNIMG